MHERRYRRGDAIFRAGDPSDVLYLVQSGTVRQEADGDDGDVMTYGPGCLFGQDGVLTGGHRPFTARALDDVALLALEAPDILTRIESDGAALRALVFAIADPPCAPLAPDTTVCMAEDAPPWVRIRPLHEDVVRDIGMTSIDVREFPYIVGRRVAVYHQDTPFHTDLVLSDAPPFWLSRQHFSIETLAGQVVVRDCGSVHGTVVNGRKLGGHRAEAFARLDREINTVLAGRGDSPFRFEISVHRGQAN